MLETIYISKEELAELPDYTVGHQPIELPVGARWKIFSMGDVFVGEKLSEEKAILKLAVCPTIAEFNRLQDENHKLRRQRAEAIDKYIECKKASEKL